MKVDYLRREFLQTVLSFEMLLILFLQLCQGSAMKKRNGGINMCSILREWQAWPGCGTEAEWSRKNRLYQIMGWGVPCKKLVGSGGATEMVVCMCQGKCLLFGKIALRNLRKEIEKRKSSWLWDRLEHILSLLRGDAQVFQKYHLWLKVISLFLFVCLWKKSNKSEF